MSEDKFDNKRPKLTFSQDIVEVVGHKGSKVQGDFVIYSTNEVPIRGIVYSSNPYVRLLKPQFDGTEVTMRFEVLGQGYQEGDRLQGYFTIVCNQRECRLPFDVQFEPDRLYGSTGEITSLADFAALAMGHWSEAMQLFYSEAFAAFIRRQPREIQMLYQGYRKAIPSSSNLEEFMVAVGVKEPVDFTVRERKEEFYGVSENRKETLTIAKSSWGYIEIQVESDSPFVTVEKETITSDYFLGSTMLLNYYIHKNRMHAGKNYARILFSCKGTVRQIEIMATLDRENVIKECAGTEKKRMQVQLTEVYKQYRFRQITTGDWCTQSVAILDTLLEENPREPWYHLMKAQCYIVNKQRQEALWIIQDMKREISDKMGATWAYLLYLCTLIEQEQSYVERLTKEIEVIFREHPEDVRIFWFLSFLREEYCQSATRKLHAIEQWINAGCHSPFLYIEAYSLYVQDPYLLHDFSQQSIGILFWAAGHVPFTRDVAMQIAHVLGSVKEFDSHIWKIACKAYEVYPEESFFADMVAYLLRNQMYQEPYLPWYREGIARDLRLSGLYEAYMLTLPDASTEEIPQMVTLYFQYSCGLPYQKKALLYANVIADRRKSPQLYEQYLRAIELFALEQMKANRINDNLAIVYQNVLEMGVVDEEMARALSGMVFMKKLVCLYPDISRVFLYQEPYEMPIVVPVSDHCAYVPVLPGNYQILLENSQGTLICDRRAYTLQRLMFPDAYMDKLQRLAPLALPYILSDFSSKKTAEDYEIEDVNRIQTVIQSSVVSRTYIRDRYAQFIAFLQSHCREELLEQHFAEEVDYHALDSVTRSFVISLFITRGNFERAYAMMQTFYGLQVDARLLLQLCNERILATEFEQDEFLVGLCGYFLEQEMVTPATVSYLSQYYVGPSPWMIALWNYAMEQKMQVLELEENILFQALYAESHLAQVSEIFASYMTRGKDKMLLEAYLNFWSHEYLLSHEGVPEQLFTYLAYGCDRELEMKESCNLAYMKFLSTVPLLSDREFHVLDRLLRRYILRNVYFAFYKDVDARLIIKYHLYDKYFVEYRGNPGERVTIQYHFDGGDVMEEEMVEMYEGIFVKQFVVFFGETIHYELYADAVSDLPVCADRLTVSGVPKEDKQDRYDMLNALQNARIYHEPEELAYLMKQYQGLDEVTRDLFTTV